MGHVLWQTVIVVVPMSSERLIFPLYSYGYISHLYNAPILICYCRKSIGVVPDPNTSA